jgi:hypothetical protein
LRHYFVFGADCRTGILLASSCPTRAEPTPLRYLPSDVTSLHHPLHPAVAPFAQAASVELVARAVSARSSWERFYRLSRPLPRAEILPP